MVRVVASETGGTEANVRRGYGPDLHRHFRIGLSEQYVKGLEIEKNFLRDWGFIAQDFDYDSWIAREPLALAEHLLAEGRVLYPELDPAFIGETP